MNLYDEKEKNKKVKKDSKLKRMILISIILLLILIIVVICLLLYLMYDPNKITLKFNGVANQEILNILDIQEDENGEMIIYAPIKTFAEKIGYKSYNGDYSVKSEDTDKCYIINDYEVVEFEKDSKKIYKLNLEEKETEYEECALNTKIAIDENSGELYISSDDMKIAFNIAIEFNKETRTINIYSLEQLFSIYGTVDDSGNGKYINTTKYEKLDESFNNKKAILDDLLIVDGVNKEKGVLKIENGKTTELLESKYDDIKYIPYNKSFFIKSNNKLGIIGSDGKTKVTPSYDSLTLIDKENDLYLVSQNNLYGVIDGDGNIIIYIEYNKIGIDIKQYTDTGIKTGYILAENLIPVNLDSTWGFYNIKGEKLTDMVYTNIGCSGNKSSNIYNLLLIPEYNVLIVQKDKKYTLIDNKGSELFNSVIDKMYIKISNGEKKYIMEVNNSTYDILEQLNKKGLQLVE